MKIFAQDHFREAMNWADAGNEALHCFSKTVRAKDPKTKQTKSIDLDMAHLYDRNAARLQITALALGIKSPRICRPDVRGQHILLAGPQVARALELLEKPKPPQWSNGDDP